MRAAALSVLRYLLIAAALGAALYSALLARAAYLFNLDTANSVLAAVRLVPYNATYVARLASWESDERQTLLRRAVALNPFDYQSLIQLGLLAEMREGDPQKAERYYLRAAGVNHMFLPRWTLTNFYFRRQDASQFFHWAKATLQITPYSSDPVFTQMWLMSQNANRLEAIVPERPKALLQYAWFLSNTSRFAAIPRSVQRLVAVVGKDDPRAWGRDDLIASMTDHMLAEGDTNDALQVWRTLKQGAWIQQRVPDEQHPLTNGNFRLPFFRHGFDWTTLPNAGVRVEQAGNGSVNLALNGNQPEHCVLLQQYVPLQPDADYLLEWRSASRQMNAASGLAWHLRDMASGDLFAPPENWQFRAPSTPGSYLLSLEYTRPSGQVRLSGVTTLNSVSLIKQ